MDISLEITDDMELIRDIMVTPDIWATAAEDGISPDEFYPGYDYLTRWFVCKEKNEPIGAILVHHDNSTTLKFHPYLLKNKRHHGREMIHLLYEWFIELPESVNKLISSIPDFNKKLHNFSKKVGFNDEGFSSESYTKNGNLHGQYMIGITRTQMKDWINERHH